MDPGMIFVIILVLLVLSFRTFRPVMHALADVIRSRLESGGTPARRDEEILALHEAVESLSAEVAKLTERVDFTERLLEKPKGEERPTSNQASGTQQAP